jgi:hypothetical protein
VDPFIGQLARLCATHRTRAKWVFVPTHALGRTLSARLVLEGRGLRVGSSLCRESSGRRISGAPFSGPIASPVLES